MTNLSYHNDPTLKKKFVAQVEKHRKADEIVQGTYGDETGGKWRGCAVACSLRSLDKLDGKPVKLHNPSHAELAKRLGIPLMLTRLEDAIFEGLDEEEALTWPTRFARAVPVGADLSGVWNKFALWLLNDAKNGVLQYAKTDAQREAISGVAELFRRKVAGKRVTQEQWRQVAAAAAAAVASSASAAADAAADAHAAAITIASAASSAADAYVAASASAAADAANAARQRHYTVMAEKLLQLMGACK